MVLPLPARSPLPPIPVLPPPARYPLPPIPVHNTRYILSAVDTRPSSPPDVRRLLGALFPELLLDALLTPQVDHLIIDAGQLVCVLGAVDNARAVPSSQWQFLQGTV